MLQGRRHPAGTAALARTVPGALADEELREPEREALLAYPSRPVKEQGGRQGGARVGLDEHPSEVLVSDQGVEAHGRPGGRSQRRGSCASGDDPSAGARIWNSMCGPSGVSAPPTVPTTCPASTSRPSTTPMSSR